MASDLDMRDLAQQYGLDYDELQQIPELAQLFQQAVAQTYSPDRFTALLKNTNWWKTTSDTQRQYIDMKTSDPATWQQKWDSTAAHVNALSVQVGLGNILGQNNPGSTSGQLNYATYAQLALGWSDDRVKNWLGSNVWTAGTAPGGEAAQAYNQLHQIAYMNGRNYGSDWYADQVRSVVSGRNTLDQVEGQVRREAASEYTGFSQQILAGQDALTLASPYVQSISSLLEKPQGSIGLDDPLLRKAMTTTGADGGSYGIWQLENDVRNDPRWRSTQNAQDATMKLARGVLGDFGLTF